MAFALGPDEGTTIEGPAGGPLTFKVRGDQTPGSLTAFENTIAPGDGPPLHRHANEDEAWYILDGRFRFRLDAELHAAPAGSFVFVPRGTPTASRTSAKPPAASSSSSPPQAWSDSSTLRRTLAGRTPTRRFRTIGAEVGMEVLGPPLRETAT